MDPYVIKRCRQSLQDQSPSLIQTNLICTPRMMQNTDQMILHFFLCKVQTTQSNMFKYLKQKTIRMQMVSLITQKSLEQKHAPSECSIKYADGRFEGHINPICVWTIYFFRFVWNVSIEIQIARKNLILLCNINSLCLTHHQSWQQHLNKILQCFPSFCSLMFWKDKIIST